MEALEIIGLKFEGSGIKPSAVKASEVAELIKSFESSLLSVLKHQDPNYNDDLIYISLDDIKEGSLYLKLRPHFLGVLTAAAVIAASFENKSFDNYNQSEIEELRVLTKFAKRHNCAGSITQGNEKLATFNKNTDVAYSEKGTIVGETTIYGEVKKAGGDRPRVTLLINNNYRVSFFVKKEIAITLASNLYKDVGLIGTAKWNKRNYRILDFKPSEVILLEHQPLEKTFKDLSSLFSPGSLDNSDFII